ncbi:KATNB1-like protein 1 isoform X1 [Latimeria chalumnae]|uniref:Katanin regulatory subunit B1 like 1 n=1 Tax=Latimeria chalumnae TaxID=7897 RepID=H3BDE3_LATCH|nr:PREDICTED: KATNB1-like protein 1 isoform X1 [Latimeria chalumnae]|eukprot:XP_005988411.2 PREDICTED: KATNB1-like protein 1 isoform X1 [Latimeria chalumnae]
MASRDHNGRKRKLLRIEEAQPIELLKKRSPPSAGENMREVNPPKEELICKNKIISIGQQVNSPHRLYRVACCKRKARPHTQGPYYRKKQQLPLSHQPRSSRGCDMANKENELACAGNLPDKLHHNNYPFMVSHRDSDSSLPDGPSSKYSDYFARLSKDHDTMTQVLFGRNLRLNVALTFWRRKSVTELIAYLVRIQDVGVLVDCLPVLTKGLEEEKQCISVGCCVDLLPLVKLLLKSQFEEYLIAGLNWLQAVIRRWWPELSANTQNVEDTLPDDRNIQLLRQQLRAFWEQGNPLTLVPGYTGSIAEAVESYLTQLR